MTSLFELRMDGSALTGINWHYLRKAQSIIQKLKTDKLVARHTKYPEGSISTSQEVFEHALSEMEELEEGLTNGDIDNVLEEIADASNCLDILAAMIIQHKESK